MLAFLPAYETLHLMDSSSRRAPKLSKSVRAVSACLALLLGGVACFAILANHSDGSAALGFLLVAAGCALLAAMGEVPTNPWATFPGREAVESFDAATVEIRAQTRRRDFDDAMASLERACSSHGIRVSFGVRSQAFMWDAWFVSNATDQDNRVDIAVQYVVRSVHEALPEAVSADPGSLHMQRIILIFDSEVSSEEQQAQVRAALPGAYDLSVEDLDGTAKTVFFCENRFTSIYSVVDSLLERGSTNNFGVVGPPVPMLGL